MYNFTITSQRRIRILCLIIFLISFFFILFLTVPGLQINDEWITANQINQLVQGHQVLLNEGKYGSESDYFAWRNNILGYSLSLPLLAAGPMLFFMMLGEYFRFSVIFFWSLIPMLVALIIQVYFPEYSKVIKIPILIPAIFGSLVLLSLNSLIYFPFPVSILINPIESAAMVFTANILFSILCVILFFIGFEIFHQPKKALFVAISLIACSSYIYWGTSGKDHILSIVLFAISLFFLCRYSNNNSRYYAALGFFFLGFTTWIRPELGLSLFFTISIFFFIVAFFSGLNGWNFREYLYRITPVFTFFAGLIPFFINNYLLTGNPLLSPFLNYMPAFVSGTSNGVVTDGIITEGSNSAIALSSGFSIEHIFSFFCKYYVLDSPSLISDIKGILFFPDNGSMPVAALTPLLFIGLVIILVLFLQRSQISESDFRILFLCICVVLGVFIAYMRSFHGLHTSEGIAPDIRYLAPIYIPGGIIGLIGMKYWKFCPIDAGLWKISIIFILIGAPILLIGMLLIQPFGGGFFYYNYTLSLCSFGLLLLLIVQYLIMEFFGRWNTWAVRGNLLLLLVVPIAWQLMMVFLFSMAKFDGYSFWIPLSELVVNSFIVPVT